MTTTEAIDAVLAEREEADHRKREEASRQYYLSLRRQRSGHPTTLEAAERVLDAFAVLGKSRATWRADLAALAARDEARQVLSDAMVTCPTAEEVSALTEASIAAQNVRGSNRVHAAEMAEKVRAMNDKLEAMTAARVHLGTLEHQHADLYAAYDALDGNTYSVPAHVEQTHEELALA